MIRRTDPDLPFPPLRPPLEARAGVFGNQELQQLRCDFDALQTDVQSLIDWINYRVRRPFEISDVARLKLEPGDVVLVRVPGLITSDVAKAIKENVEKAIPGHKCIVCTGGIEVAALSQDPKP